LAVGADAGAPRFLRWTTPGVRTAACPPSWRACGGKQHPVSPGTCAANQIAVNMTCLLDPAWSHACHHAHVLDLDAVRAASDAQLLQQRLVVSHNHIEDSPVAATHSSSTHCLLVPAAAAATKQWLWFGSPPAEGHIGPLDALLVGCHAATAPAGNTEQAQIHQWGGLPEVAGNSLSLQAIDSWGACRTGASG
jgi:hypothetical protein